MWQMSAYLVLLWTCIDLLIPPLFVSVWFTEALTQVLCPRWVINISWSQQHPSIFYTVSHLFLLCDWPLLLFDWICFVPLVSARANLPHRHSFGLLFRPPALGKTVCSKDCNLTANLYGFLQGRALSTAEWFAGDVETLWSLRSSLLRASWVWREFAHAFECASCHCRSCQIGSQKVCQVVFV